MAVLGFLLLMSWPAAAVAGNTVWGYVGKDASTPAMFATVELVDRSSGKVVDEATTNFFGKYSFADVRPG
ncbi:MAG TPA: hypothetical protein VNI58_06075, partial [Mariprofundaceae bacterium]|nr:hypothetical protein [Mariprofundaceae bacterium]